jgi:hypothetical protein
MLICKSSLLATTQSLGEKCKSCPVDSPIKNVASCHQLSKVGREMMIKRIIFRAQDGDNKLLQNVSIYESIQWHNPEGQYHHFHHHENLTADKYCIKRQSF